MTAHPSPIRMRLNSSAAAGAVDERSRLMADSPARPAADAAQTGSVPPLLHRPSHPGHPRHLHVGARCSTGGMSTSTNPRDLPRDPRACPPWCVLGDASDADVPAHLSAMVPVPLVVRAVDLVDGLPHSVPSALSCWVGLLETDGETYLTCATEEGPAIDLTPESARRLIEALRLYLRVLDDV
ncbi:MAG: hypothetical protein ACFWTS_04230 [Pseudoclavibacter caeni]|jgi:hypothetical protein